MKFTKVTYSKLYPLQQFSNEKIGVELEIQEGESPLAALEEAKKLVEEFYQQNIKLEEQKQVTNIKEELPKSQKGVIEQILGCKTEKELSEWEIYVNSKNGEPLKGIYEQRKMQLKNGS